VTSWLPHEARWKRQFRSPHIVLQDANEVTIADSVDQVAIYPVALAVQLTAAAYTYTRPAPMAKHRKLDLTLAKAEIRRRVRRWKDGRQRVVCVLCYSRAAHSPSLRKLGGEFSPAVAVRRIDNHELRTVAELSGQQVVTGSIGIKPKQQEIYRKPR